MIATQLSLPGNFPSHITIIDDDPNAANVTADNIQDIGDFEFQIIAQGAFKKVDDLAAQMIMGQTCVVCDHRLSPYGLASFSGAEFVSYCNNNDTPAILLTQFSEQDDDVSIRRYRRHVPVLLPRHYLSPEAIDNGLKTCWQEIKGEVAEIRRPHRTLVEIAYLKTEDSEDVVDAFIPGWKTDVAVRFPLSLIDDKWQSTVKSTLNKKERAYLFAEVNIGADTAADLFFEKFELAIPPKSEFYLDAFANAAKAK